MARGLAVDLAPIRVNTVSSGAVYTEMFDEIPETGYPRSCWTSDTLYELIGLESSNLQIERNLQPILVL